MPRIVNGIWPAKLNMTERVIFAMSVRVGRKGKGEADYLALELGAEVGGLPLSCYFPEPWHDIIL